VNAIALNAGTVWVAGGFAAAGGGAHSGIAALDSATGLARDWHPVLNTGARAVAVSGNRVYVAGDFTIANGTTRNHLAAFDATTGELLAWNPNSSHPATGLVAERDRVWATGWFSVIGGAARFCVAQLDTLAGAATTWSAAPNTQVYALARDGATVRVGGSFTLIGGQPRSRLATLDDAAGLATSWNAGANGPVSTIAIAGDATWVGGDFTSVGGQWRTGLARVLAVDALPPSVAVLSPGAGAAFAIGSVPTLTWTADDAQGVHSVDLWLSRGGPSGPWELIAAGLAPDGAYAWAVSGPATPNAVVRVDARDFAGNLATATSATFRIGDAGASVPRTLGGLALEPPAPNPARTAQRIVFALPRETVVRLELIDIAGRTVATLADGALGPGRHEAHADVSALRPGLYFVRLRAEGASVVRRVAIAR